MRSVMRDMARKIRHQQIYIELLEYALSVENPLNNLKMLTHTTQCSSYIVGGISLNHKLPNSRQVWRCSPDCPLNESGVAIGGTIEITEEEEY